MKRGLLNIMLISTALLLLGATVQSKKRYDSYKGLVMAGYQGWFTAPGDGAGRGFHHYQGSKGFKPGSCSVDFWPDVSEYEKTYPTPFTMANGDTAHVFSSYDESTVDTHFRWMKQYGLDGVFMQRFVTEIRGTKGKKHFDKVLASAMKSSTKYGRAIVVMYDLSGMRPGGEQTVLNDIDEISETYDLKNRKKVPGYLFHNGAPLVTLWGVGFNDKRDYGLKEVETMVKGLKARGFSVMLGVPTYWRELKNDAVQDSKLHELIRSCDIIMPWFVGRYDETSYEKFKSILPKDIEWAKENKVDYVPLCYPGFSWKNMEGDKSLYIPRNKGSFLWKQYAGAIAAGAEMLYVAMFDEIDEGTAIFKCATEVPVGASKFVPIEEGLKSDHYLWLTGQAKAMLLKKRKFTETLPLRK